MGDDNVVNNVCHHGHLLPGSLPTMRLLTVVKDQYPEKLEELSRQAWMRIWSRVC